MRNLKLIALLFIASTLTFCGKQEQPENAESIRIKQKIIETYDSTKVTDTKTINYEYRNNKDCFWTKAVYKDKDGKIIKTISRELDAKGFPAKEAVNELDAVTETDLVRYNPQGLLLETTEYQGDLADGKKVSTNRYIYDNDGYLTGEELIYYSTDPNYKNADGNNTTYYHKLRFFPKKENRPKGEQKISWFIESQKSYCTEASADGKLKSGDLEMLTETKFNEEGMPVYYKSNQPDCIGGAQEEWYKTEKDRKGNVIAITGYINEKMDMITEANIKDIYEYDDNGMIKYVRQFKYNPETKQFDKFHDLQSFEWVKSPGCCQFPGMEASRISEHFCYHRIRHSIIDERIVKFDKNEKITEKYTDAYDGPLGTRKLEPKLRTRTIDKFEKFLCSGKTCMK